MYSLCCCKTGTYCSLFGFDRRERQPKFTVDAGCLFAFLKKKLFIYSSLSSCRTSFFMQEKKPSSLSDSTSQCPPQHPPAPQQTNKNEYLYLRTSVSAMGNKIKSEEQTDRPTNWFQTRVKAPQQFFVFFLHVNMILSLNVHLFPALSRVHRRQTIIKIVFFIIKHLLSLQFA